jgi:hypothetical protein
MANVTLESTADNLRSSLNEALRVFRDVELSRREQMDEVHAFSTTVGAGSSGNDAIFLFPLSNLTFYVRLVVYRKFGAPYENTELAFYDERAGKYLSLSVDEVIERIMQSWRDPDEADISLTVDPLVILQDVQRAVEQVKSAS